LHKKSLHIDFSVQPLCSLCLGGVFLLGIHQPQRPREHRGCTEKRAFVTFCAKPHDVIERRAEDSQKNKKGRNRCYSQVGGATSLDSELEHSCAQGTWIETEVLRRAILSFNSPADIFHSVNNVFAFNFFQSLY